MLPKKSYLYPRMAHNLQNPDGHAPVEQSWIVLDDQGWSSRPPTASPSRQLTLSRQLAPPTLTGHESEEEDESDGSRRVHRLGMDRDVREALELAERSLELAGSAEEFAGKVGPLAHDEETDVIRASPMMNYVVRDSGGGGGIAFSDNPEDPYRGRNPPVVRRTPPNVAENVRVVSSTTAVNLSSASASPFVPFATAQPMALPVRNLSPGPKGQKLAPDDEEDGSLIHWFFGLSPNSSPVPLILSHILTLAAGYYIGTRRVPAMLPQAGLSVTSATAQSVNQ
jgi:hypothetical protein